MFELQIMIFSKKMGNSLERGKKDWVFLGAPCLVAERLFINEDQNWWRSSRWFLMCFNREFWQLLSSINRPTFKYLRKLEVHSVSAFAFLAIRRWAMLDIFLTQRLSLIINGEHQPDSPASAATSPTQASTVNGSPIHPKSWRASPWAAYCAAQLVTAAWVGTGTASNFQGLSSVNFRRTVDGCVAYR